jgi:hypothetical protein
MSDPRMAKLPKWAREHIADLQREANEANRRADDLLLSQTPTSVVMDKGLDMGDNPLFLDDAEFTSILYYMNGDMVQPGVRNRSVDEKRLQIRRGGHQGSRNWSEIEPDRITVTALGGRRPLIQVEPKMANEIIIHWVDRY